MATGAELYQALQVAHPNVDLSSSGLLNDANTAAANGSDASGFVNQYYSDPRVSQAYAAKQQTLYGPTNQGYATQEQTIGQQRQQAQQALGQNTGQVNNQYDYSKSNILANQYAQNDSLDNAADAAGLTRTGGNYQGNQNIAQDTTRALTYNENQRANTLAQLALQKSQQDTSLSGALSQVEAQKAATNQQMGLDATQSYNQDSQDYFNRNLQLAQLGMSLPSGRSVDVGPGYQVTGSMQNPSGALKLFNDNLSLIGTPGTEGLFADALRSTGVNVDTSTLDTLWNEASQKRTGSGSGTPPAKTPPPATGYTSPVAKYGIPDTTYNKFTAATNGNGQNYASYFKSGAYQGNDAADIASIGSNYGVTPDQSSALYYNYRHQVIGK